MVDALTIDFSRIALQCAGVENSLLISLLVASFVALAIVAVAASVTWVVHQRYIAAPTAPKEDPSSAGTPLVQEAMARIAALEVLVQGLPSLWEEERERARKHSERAQAAERSAQKLRDEQDDGLGEGSSGDIHPRS